MAGSWQLENKTGLKYRPACLLYMQAYIWDHIYFLTWQACNWDRRLIECTFNIRKYMYNTFSVLTLIV